MKIYGTNRSNINPYYDQQQKLKQTEQKQTKDHLEISETAKNLQKNDQLKENRDKYIETLKQQVSSGEYKVNITSTSQKIIDFFTKK
ncbi:MAG TPA: flagellar biosynthesis anti-sigma factor FlgM [Bacillota bacterium]|nr:flagellar biosynthesis anti-sigma factor FlgM [Bacillota bacterium]